MSALDDALTQAEIAPYSDMDISSARKELAQLREKATEYDRIADLIDPYHAYEKSIYDQIVDLLHDDTSREYPEVDALRARLDELESDHSLLTKRLQAVIDDRDDYAQQLTQSKIERVRANERIAEQARQLDAARKALLAWHIVELNECGEDIFPLMKQLDEIDLYESGDDLSLWAQGLMCAWLAANPAPQEPQP